MSDTERGRKPHYVRRNPPSRPLPGVQKAMHNFGVRDLREILDKKQQTQGDQSFNDTKKKLPPPDPSYNYLKDPTRDRQSPPTNKKEPKKQSQQFYQNPKLSRSKTDPNIKNGDSDASVSKKKELRFADSTKPLETEHQTYYRRGQGSFRGRGRPRKVEQFEKIENPVNIKIELSMETGKRSYVLDESTKIGDIKHVPDNLPNARPLRGAPRGNFRARGRGRGNFRGRGRSFRGRGGYNRKDEQQKSEDQNNGKDVEQDEEEECHNTNKQKDEFSSEYNEQGNEIIGQENTDEAQNEHREKTEFNSNLAGTITITSSTFDDGEIKRSVDIKDNDEEC